MTVSAIHEGNLTKSLDALRVFDFSTAIAGPHGMRMLADLCAEVIEIVSADGGTIAKQSPVSRRAPNKTELSRRWRRGSVQPSKSPKRSKTSGGKR